MKRGVLSLFLISITVQAAVQQTPAPQAKPFLLRVFEWQTTMKSVAGPNNLGNCMIVYSDGRLHLELRRQEFFYGPASLMSYEGTLSTRQLAFLRSILDIDTMTNLPGIHQPSGPTQGEDFGSFSAEIQRPTALQTVGFRRRHSTKDDEEAWHEAAVVLQPLVDWTHEVKSSNPPELRPVPNGNSVCDE
jgi:hypothetical protein